MGHTCKRIQKEEMYLSAIHKLRKEATVQKRKPVYCLTDVKREKYFTFLTNVVEEAGTFDIPGLEMFLGERFDIEDPDYAGYVVGKFIQYRKKQVAA